MIAANKERVNKYSCRIVLEIRSQFCVEIKGKIFFYLWPQFCEAMFHS